MAQKLLSKLMPCPTCGRETKHHKNSKQMSWVMHLVLTILTAGIWLIFLMLTMIWHGLTKPKFGKWTCSVCGEKH